MRAKIVNRKKAGDKRNAAAGDRGALIKALEERNVSLEKELQARQEEFCAMVDELRLKNDALEQRVRELKQIRETLELTRFSMDHASDSIFWLKPDGGFHDVNEAPCKLLGYSREELLQMSVWDIDPDIDSKQFKELWKDTTRHGSITFETRTRAKDGTIYPVEVTGNRLVFGGREYVFAFVKNITERKQAEEEMIFTRFALEKFGDSAIWIDSGGRLIYVNEATCRSVGYTKDELLSMHIWDLDPDYTREKFSDLWERTKRDRRQLKFETRHVARDGRVFPVEVTSSYIRYGDREYMITFDRDITERKRAEESLQLMQHVIDHVQDWASLVSPDGRFCYVNDAHCQALGYTREELLALHIWDVDVHVTEDRWPLIWSDLKEKGFLKVEDLHRARDGRTFPTEIYVSYLNFHGSEYMCGFVRDITGRKQAEEAVKLASAYNRSLIEASMDPLVTISPEGVIMDVNKATEKVTGCSRKELIGTDFSCYFTEPEKAKEGYREAFTAGSVRDYPLEIRDRNGHVTPVIYNASVYRDETGKVIGVFAAARDITARRQAEQELKQAKAEAELYLDLMGHDIRNMNQIGMGFLEIAMGSQDISKNDKEMLMMALGSLEKSTRLIENVRKLQKARSGELKRYEIDACQTITRVLAHFSSMPGIRASFNYEISPTCMVMANDLLYEVFENIVGNAIKHGGPEPVIDVRFDMVTVDGRRYNRFSVEDNGPGIPDAMKSRIFNRLQRGDTKAKGMGLGLYLVKSLIDSYGGSVRVEDRVAGDHTKGARFVVMLPAVQSPESGA
ncbi:MAG: sensory histidine kinase AtoS [Methanocella sp. PtaU1.Bin125]|nr:MAG: sensory histidine kinase AtoS [Methanocella sp. PtaU1.Bin125]